MADAIAGDITIAPDGEFSLAAAASFGFGPNTGRPKPDGDSMSLAFVADDMRHHAAAVVTQDGSRRALREVSQQIDRQMERCRSIGARS